MTKERYFEMCEALGNEPLEEEIPPDFDELPVEAQTCFYIYNLLRDNWDYMGGNYIGKNFDEFWKLLEVMQVPSCDHKFYYETVWYIDRMRADHIAKEQKKKENKPAK